MSSSRVSAVAASTGRPSTGPVLWHLGELSANFGDHAPAGAPPQGAVLLIPCHGPLILHQGQIEQLVLPPQDLLYLPSEAVLASCSGFHGWRLALDPRRLGLLASELSGHRLRPSRCLPALRDLRILQPRQGDVLDLCDALRGQLELVGASTTAGRQQLERAGLDQCILRLLVLLLCSEPLETPPPAAPLARHGRDEVFDDLLVWILANLHRPIRLEDLARQSCYSARSLCNFFHERFQCGPVQWIRRQRLLAARQRLLQPVAGDTVSKVATEFGYSNLAQFSRDFQRQFQINPSQLLREGLRNRHAAAPAAADCNPH